MTQKRAALEELRRRGRAADAALEAAPEGLREAVAEAAEAAGEAGAGGMAGAAGVAGLGPGPGSGQAAAGAGAGAEGMQIDE